MCSVKLNYVNCMFSSNYQSSGVYSLVRRFAAVADGRPTTASYGRSMDAPDRAASVLLASFSGGATLLLFSGAPSWQTSERSKEPLAGDDGGVAAASVKG